jgi:hypothetical protein
MPLLSIPGADVAGQHHADNGAKLFSLVEPAHQVRGPGTSQIPKRAVSHECMRKREETTIGEIVDAIEVVNGFLRSGNAAIHPCEIQVLERALEKQRIVVVVFQMQNVATQIQNCERVLTQSPMNSAIRGRPTIRLGTMPGETFPTYSPHRRSIDSISPRVEFSFAALANKSSARAGYQFWRSGRARPAMFTGSMAWRMP